MHDHRLDPVRIPAQIAAAQFLQSFLAQRRAATNTVQGSLDAAANRRITRNGATKRIASAGRQGRRAIASLDAIVSHLILGDERLEREW